MCPSVAACARRCLICAWLCPVALASTAINSRPTTAADRHRHKHRRADKHNKITDLMIVKSAEAFRLDMLCGLSGGTLGVWGMVTDTHPLQGS
jgi:hypothetical protein